MVKKCKLDVPPGLAQLYGDMFKACDIKVHYSEVDNDDTIASYAQKNGACVISGDKDYYRYLGGTFKIYSDYEIINGQIELTEAEYFTHPNLRDLLNPLPPTHSKSQYVARLFKTLIFEKGCPSALTRYTGSLHILVRPLRQAYYHRLGIHLVKESFVLWNPWVERTQWTKDDIKSDDTLVALLDDPIQAVEHFLPKL